MMSYLWILLLGSLLASRATAQEEDGPVPEISDDAEVSLDDAEAETEAVNTDAEEPQLDEELEPAADDPETPEAMTPTASDPEVAPPAGDGDPEEESEETNTDAADAPVEGEEEETTTITADLPADIGEEISTTAEPEPLETTAPTEEENPEASGEAATPTPADEQVVTTTTTTAILPEQEISTTTTPPPFPVVPVREAKQTTITPTTTPSTTTTPPTPAPTPTLTTTAEVKEILVVTEAPSDPEEVTPASGADETTFIDNYADQVEEKVLNPVKDSRKIFASLPLDAASHDTPETDETSSKPLAAVLSGIVVSAVGAVAAYFTYQKKKLCFKNRQEADPEAGNKGEKADPAEAKSNPEALAPLVDQKS
uniref:Si:ch211-39i22.1 n=1 Tax=Nothobranchius kadleci TaxID=1051664 RepID=A0A1A8D9N4_NOTKA